MIIPSLEDTDRQVLDQARSFCNNHARITLQFWVGFGLIAVWFILIIVGYFLHPEDGLDKRAMLEGGGAFAGWFSLWRCAKREERMARYIVLTIANADDDESKS